MVMVMSNLMTKRSQGGTGVKTKKKIPSLSVSNKKQKINNPDFYF